MLRNGDKDIVPPKFDNEGNPTNNEEGSKLGASTGPTLEELMRRVEKLTAKNKKLRAKAKGRKTKGSSSLSEEEYLKRMSPKREKGKEIVISLPTTQCLLITIICLALPLILLYLLTRLLILMELVITNGSIA
jgi:hypothetical protein